MNSESITINTAPGTPYRYIPTGERYRMVGVSLDGRTRQEQIVYRGEGGRDDGRMINCSLSDFAQRFEEVVEAAPAVAVVAPAGKTLDHSSKGNPA